MKVKRHGYLQNFGLATSALLGCFASASVFAQQDRVRVIEPNTRVEAASPAAIDTERFELGAYLGSISVEDFGTDVVTGIEFNYHINSDWLVQFNYGIAEIDRAAFEVSSSFLADSDRDFKYYSLAAGYRLFNGRSFFGMQGKYDSSIYLFAGPEQVSFAGNDEVGLNLGLSYRVVLTDWLTANIDFREHIFERDFIGESKQTFNTEFRVGVNALF